MAQSSNGEQSEMPFSLQANFPYGACLLEVEVFSSSKVPLRVLIGFFSNCSSHGSYCRSPSSEFSTPPVSMASSVGSVGGWWMMHCKMNVTRSTFTVFPAGSVQAMVLYRLRFLLLMVWLPRVVAGMAPGVISSFSQGNNLCIPHGLCSFFI